MKSAGLFYLSISNPQNDFEQKINKKVATLQKNNIIRYPAYKYLKFCCTIFLIHYISALVDYDTGSSGCVVPPLISS